MFKNNVSFQELFEAIDKEDDGAVYLKDIVIHLRALNEEVDKNLKVKVFLDQLDTNGSEEVDFEQFMVDSTFISFTYSCYSYVLFCSCFICCLLVRR